MFSKRNGGGGGSGGGPGRHGKKHVGGDTNPYSKTNKHSPHKKKGSGHKGRSWDAQMENRPEEEDPFAAELLTFRPYERTRSMLERLFNYLDIDGDEFFGEIIEFDDDEGTVTIQTEDGEEIIGYQDEMFLDDE